MMETDNTPPIEVDTLVGDWRVGDRLGKGGMASVYKLTHATTGDVAALKVLDIPSSGLRRRLIQEGELQATLSSPFILRVLDIIEVNHCPGLILEFVDGPDLSVLIHQESLGPEDINAIATGLLEGMAEAHDQGILHRDLKPQNVLVGRHGKNWVPKIADFGLAKALTDEAGGTVRTRTGQLMGTPQYMAPEQFKDSKHLNTQADVFSLGAILYEMTTGQRAFDGEDVFEIYDKVSRSDYPTVASLAPDTPEAWQVAIERALRLDPNRRPTTAGALLALWEGAAPRKERRQTLAPASASTIPPVSMSRGVAAGALVGMTGLTAGGAILATLVVVGAAWWMWGQPTPPPPVPVPAAAPIAPAPVVPAPVSLPPAPDPDPEPTPVAPVPTPVKPVPQRPKPEPVVVVGSAEVTLSGASAVILTSRGSTYVLKAGASTEVPAGTYAAKAIFPQKGEVEIESIRLRSGPQKLTCVSGFYTCSL